MVEGPTGTGSGGFDDPKQRADLRFLGGARRVISVGLQCMNESGVGGQGLVDMMHHFVEHTNRNLWAALHKLDAEHATTAIHNMNSLAVHYCLMPNT